MLTILAIVAVLWALALVVLAVGSPSRTQQVERALANDETIIAPSGDRRHRTDVRAHAA